MANMKEFTIKVNGVESAYKDIVNLSSALKHLGDAIGDVNSKTLSSINVINQSTTIINENTGTVQQNIEVLQDASAEVEQFNDNVSNAAGSITNLTAKTESNRPAMEGWKEVIKSLQIDFEDLGEKIKGAIDYTSKMVDVVNTGASVASLFEKNSNGAKEVMEQMTKVMAVVNTLQSINNTVLKEGGILSKTFSAMESARATVTKMTSSATAAATITVKAFSKALMATGVGAVVTLLGYLIANFDKVKETVLELFPQLSRLGEVFDEVKAIVAGVAKVIVGQVVSGIKTFISVIKKVIDLDFKGALEEIRTGVENHVKQFDKYKEGHDEQVAKNEEEKARERAKSRQKELKDIIDDNESKSGADWRYTKEGQKIYREYFQKKMDMYKKDSEEFKAAQREKWTYERLLSERNKPSKTSGSVEISEEKEEKEEKPKIDKEQVKFKIDVEDLVRDDLERVDKIFAEERKKRFEKSLTDLKKNITEENKVLEAQSKKIKELSEEAVSRKGRHNFIDVEETKKNLSEVKKELESYLTTLNSTKTKIESEYDTLLSTYDKDTKEYKRAQMQKEEAISNLETQIKKTNKQIKDNMQQEAKVYTDHWKEVAAKLQGYADNIMSGVNEIFKATNAILEDELNSAKEKLEVVNSQYDEMVKKREESDGKVQALEQKAKDAKGGYLLVLQAQINQEMEANKKLAEQEKELAKEKEKQEKEIAKKEKQQKRVKMVQDIIQATSNIAMGVAKAWGFGPILGPVLAAVVAAAGAVQIGVMTKQLAKLEDGGLLRGKRHAQGGMRIEGTNIEVEGGEYVVNRESTDKNIGLIRYINSQRRELTPSDVSSFFARASQGFEPPFSRAFESGGQLPAIATPDNIDNETLVEAIRSIRIEPRVAVSDINRVQDEMVSVDNWVGL